MGSNEIYKAIKKIGFSGERSNFKENWKNAALNCFEKNNFKCIKKEYLSISVLYELNIAKPKLKFTGELLKIIANEIAPGNYSAESLLEIFNNS